MPRHHSRRLMITGGVASVAAALLAFTVDARRPVQADAAPADDATQESTCEDGARRPAVTGQLVNNAWNRASAGPGPWRQCLRSRRREGKMEFGWSWHWPSRDGLYAYPEVLVGRSPWNDLASNDARFPATIDTMRRMWIDYDIESRHQGKKNLALEFWLTDASMPSSVAAIRAEVMIWTDASAGMETPSEPPDDIVDIDGQRWAVRARRGWGDASGGSGHKWTFVTYRALRPASTAHYDARHILQHAVDRGWVDGHDRVEGVELGNEITSGSGSTWIRRFDVTVE